ncbi:MAG: family 10 glycosylhydrolase [Kiritimatiellia bacterium]
MAKLRQVLVLACALFGGALAPLSAAAAEVVVVAHDPGYCTSLARHLQRGLRQQNIASDVVTPQTMSAALKSARVAFLVGFDNPPPQEIDVLRAYRARGGRLVVFYSSSPALAALMGVRLLGYATASTPGRWSTMRFASTFPEGLPTEIRQNSTVLQRAAPEPGRGRVLATWYDRAGRSTGDAAWISSAGGFWMTHVLLADGDVDLKAQLVAALVGCYAPHLWNYAAAAARKAAEHQAARAYALRQVPRKGEIHAVWDHSGCGLYPGNWPKTMHVLREARVTDLFVNVAGAGFAHYASDVLPRSKTYEQEGDQLAACLAAAKRTGIRVHAWILCFNATRATPARKAELKRNGWLVKTTDGRVSEDYLDPSRAAVQACILGTIDEIQAKYAVQGIHLDFVRWYEKSVKPANAAAVITGFVRAARRRVKRPCWLTAAVLGKYPASIASVGQDWDGWLGGNLVDYVVPMDYSEDPRKFAAFLQQHAQNRRHAARTIVGIGVTANESHLSPRQVIDQINLVRRYGLAGVSLFDLDTTLEKNILPYLKLGIW